MQKELYKIDVCRCGHLPVSHKGFNWFHMTKCKENNCPCEKYLKGKSILNDTDGEYGDILLKSNPRCW